MANNLQAVGGAFQDLEFKLCANFETLSAWLTVNIPLQENALGSDAGSKSYSDDGHGIYINPHVELSVTERLSLLAGAYAYNIGNNPDADFSKEQKRLALEPFFRVSYRVY
jgi:hypothetical protein